jgi:ring-1,2-phenylacetyl-CoA epoxidase subunit PaaD
MTAPATDRRTEVDRIWSILETVVDPEIPVLSVVDLGVAREVRFGDDGRVEVVITPTYTGCPATVAIELSIVAALEAASYRDPKVTTVLAPAWTTDWLSEAGRRKLEAFGIAPPARAGAGKRALFEPDDGVRCPRCRSTDTERISEFGSTPCKALYRCRACLEPFDSFKCH